MSKAQRMMGGSGNKKNLGNLSSESRPESRPESSSGSEINSGTASPIMCCQSVSWDSDAQGGVGGPNAGNGR